MSTPAKAELRHISEAAALVRRFDELGRVNPNDVNRIAQAICEAESRGELRASGRQGGEG